MTAVLGGFSRASKVNEVGAVDEQSNYGNDIEQFGQLLATLLGNCHSSSEYILTPASSKTQNIQVKCIKMILRNMATDSVVVAFVR